MEAQQERTPDLVFHVDDQLREGALVEALQLLGDLRQQRPDVELALAKVELRLSYLLSTWATSSSRSSELQRLARHHGDLARQLLQSQRLASQLRR